MSSILVVQQAGRNRISLEALAAGRVLAGLTGLPLETAAVGDSNAVVFIETAGPVPATAWSIQHPLLEHYSSDGFVLAFEQLIRKLEPAYIVFPHTYQVRDFVPRLATRFGQVLISDVASIEAGPSFVRQLFQGKMNGSYRHPENGPCFISVQAGAFPALPPQAGTTNIQNFVPEIASGDIRTSPGEPFRASSQTIDLASAQLIVGVGRGIKDAANIPIVQALATALGAELAASRPICDAEWLPMERQVGSSGQTVAPKLYLAVGISGAIQHLVGIKGSQCIVAINKDPNAPIFEIADYAIVGDLFEVVPAVTAAINAARQ
jgi:electron transfer flavoprotein alpha subunit